MDNTKSVEQLVLQLKLSGFCLLADVIPSSEVGRVRDSVLESVRQHARRSNFAPERTSQIAGLIRHDQSFAEFLVDERLTSIVTALLGEHYRVSFTTALVNHPGNERGQWHSDWPFIQTLGAKFPAPYPDMVMHLTTLFMLSDFSIETGATIALPGSHRFGNNPTADLDLDRFEALPGELQVTGKAGSVLLLDSRCWHAAAPNRSEEDRVAVAVRFAPWWLNLEVLRPNSFLRQQMVDRDNKPDAPVPTIPPGVFAELPEKVQPLFHHWIDTTPEPGGPVEPS